MSIPPAPRLSVVIPAYNEESRLPATLDAVLAYLAAREPESEVLVVDDGSTDGTAGSVEERIARAPCSLRLLRHADGANHGKGASVALGLATARGRYRLFLDSDHSTTIEQIERLWPAFADGAAVVIGSRAVPGARIEVPQSLVKRLAGKAGNLLIQALLLPGILDSQAGFKMLTATAAECIAPRLTLPRWGFDFELLAIARHHGLAVREVPIVWRNSPSSKVRPADYLAVLREVWLVRRRLRRGEYD